MPILWFLIKTFAFLFIYVWLAGRPATPALRPAHGPRLEAAHPLHPRLAAAGGGLRALGCGASASHWPWWRGLPAHPGVRRRAGARDLTRQCSRRSVDGCCHRNSCARRRRRATSAPGREAKGRADGLLRGPQVRRQLLRRLQAHAPTHDATTRDSVVSGREEAQAAPPARRQSSTATRRHEKCIGCELCAGVCPATASTCAASTTRPTTRSRPGSATATSTRSTTCAVSTATCVSSLPDRGDHRVEALRVLLHQPLGRHLHQARAVVDDEGRPQKMPWEDWREGDDLMTSGWMRATSPAGNAAYEARSSVGELGYGVRAPRGPVGPARRQATGTKALRDVLEGHLLDETSPEHRGMRGRAWRARVAPRRTRPTRGCQGAPSGEEARRRRRDPRRGCWLMSGILTAAVHPTSRPHHLHRRRPHGAGGAVGYPVAQPRPLGPLLGADPLRDSRTVHRTAAEFLAASR